jgi:hypothetical protein
MYLPGAEVKAMSATQDTEMFSNPKRRLSDLEQSEVLAWARIAEDADAQGVPFVAGCEDHRSCQLLFNIISKDRKGRPVYQLCTSKSLGASSAVLICRHELPPFHEVQLQLDDEQDRPWVRAKVAECKQTVGGYAVRVEFLTEARQAA